MHIVVTKKGNLETKLIFDCTKPMPPRVPPEVKERMNPENYVRPLSEQDISYLKGER